jgi:hypothetical protein
MEIDGNWWGLVEIDGDWWRLVEIDGDWWRLMEIRRRWSGANLLLFTFHCSPFTSHLSKSSRKDAKTHFSAISHQHINTSAHQHINKFSSLISNL